MELPEVIVGVDFGMTTTGVAYSAGPDWARPETIQNWPGNQGGAIADKVASRVAYDSVGNIISWGFMVHNIGVSAAYRYEELFKLYLDPDFRDPYEGAPSLQEARLWFTDYLSCIHLAVNRHLADTIPRYSSRRVEFRFSVPTTWKNPAMIAETEQLIRNAGFGRDDQLHRVEISLTEAEAAAVYASKQQYSTGDIFLVCDAGGGTTDVNILKVKSSGIGRTELEPMSWVEGRAIGSTLIDFRVEKLIAERLQSIRSYLRADPQHVAHRMLRDGSRFESFKCNLGDEAMDLPTLRLSIPGLSHSLKCREPFIDGTQMIITKQELQSIFDDQVSKIINLIDDQLLQMEKRYPGQAVTYLILSGGLGSSPYLQSRLKAYYGLGRSRASSMRDLQILKVPKPQLSVCHGLVLDRVQQIKQNRVIYRERFCRNSYGVVVRMEYNPKLHHGEPVTVDPRDKKKWVEQQIDWFIMQGQKVSVQDGVKQHYSLKIPPGERHQGWGSQIVMSTLPADRLPTSLNQDGAQRLCKVVSQLPSEMKLKNRHWYNAAPQYLRAEFDMRVIIGPADLKFQTLSPDGVLSQDHESISVEWFPSAKGLSRSQLAMAELEGSSISRSNQTVQKWSK